MRFVFLPRVRFDQLQILTHRTADNLVLSQFCVRIGDISYVWNHVLASAEVHPIIFFRAVLKFLKITLNCKPGLLDVTPGLLHCECVICTLGTIIHTISDNTE